MSSSSLSSIRKMMMIRRVVWNTTTTTTNKNKKKTGMTTTMVRRSVHTTNNGTPPKNEKKDSLFVSSQQMTTTTNNNNHVPTKKPPQTTKPKNNNNNKRMMIRNNNNNNNNNSKSKQQQTSWKMELESKTNDILSRYSTSTSTSTQQLPGVIQKEISDCIMEWSQLWSRRRSNYNYKQDDILYVSSSQQPKSRRAIIELQTNIHDIQKRIPKIHTLLHILLNHLQHQHHQQQQQQQQSNHNHNQEETNPPILQHDENKKKDENNITKDGTMAKVVTTTTSSVNQRQKQQQQQVTMETLCNVVMNGWAKSYLPEGGQKATEILDRMEHLYQQQQQQLLLSDHDDDDNYQKMYDTIRPTTFTYASVLDAWSKCPSSNSTQQANAILHRLETTTSTTTTMNKKQDKKQLLICYNSVLNAHVQKKCPKELKAAEQLLQKMEQPNFYISPDVYSYSTVLNGYAQCRHNNNSHNANPHKAKQLLQRMIQRNTNTTKVQPNNITFGTVITCYVNTTTSSKQLKDAAEQAEQILNWMIDLSLRPNNNNNNNNQLTPTNIHFGSVMNAYSKKRSLYGAKRAQRLFDQMMTLYEQENLNHFQPNHQSFVICMDAWAKSRAPGAATHAEKMLYRMEELFLQDEETSKTINNYGYNLVIDAWSKSGEKGSAKKAEAILQRMKEVYAITKNSAVLPDKISYTSVMKAWINGREKGFEDKAATLLSDMEQMYYQNTNNNEKVKPDTIAYANVIDGFAKAGKPHLAEIVLKRMEDLYQEATTSTSSKSSSSSSKERYNKDVKPNVTCYNILMNAYGKSKTKGSLNKCEELLKRMENNPDPTLRPNHISYTTYLDALAQSNDNDNDNETSNNSRVEKAEEILSRMIQRYQVEQQQQRTTTTTIKPTVHTWNTIIFIYAKSKNLPQKSERAVEVFQRMKQFGTQPDIVTYNSLLNACSFVPEEEKEMALRIALTLFESLYQTKKISSHQQKNNNNNNNNDVHADATTYKSILNVCREHIDNVEKREKVIADIFLKCREEGQVSETIIATLRISVSNELFWNLLEKKETDEHVKMKDLPLEWSRNVSHNNYIHKHKYNHKKKRHRNS